MMVDKWIPSRSTLSFVKEYFSSKAIHTAVSKVPIEYWSFSELELTSKSSITYIDRCIQLRLWQLLHTVEYPHKIKTSEIHQNICSYTNMYNYILSNPIKVAWLFCPLNDISAQLEVHKRLLALKLKNILLLPDKTENGQPAYKNLRAIIRVAELVLREQK